jgi:hypothetical protein
LSVICEKARESLSRIERAAHGDVRPPLAKNHQAGMNTVHDMDRPPVAGTALRIPNLKILDLPPIIPHWPLRRSDTKRQLSAIIIIVVHLDLHAMGRRHYMPSTHDGATRQAGYENYKDQ